MNRPLGEILADILAETGCSPLVMARNMKNAASPHLKTPSDHWVWGCEVVVGSTKQGGIERIQGAGETPDDAAAACYRLVLANDRSTWRDKTLDTRTSNK